MRVGNPEKYFENGEINRALMWVTLRNMFYTINKKEASQLIPYEAVQNVVKTQENTERLDALERIELKIKAEMQNWDEYDRQLFILYRNSGLSMRRIEAEVGIDYSSVWRTLNKCKERLSEAIGEDWQDYMNEDYELI
jgi:DNA-directed RNA polymerase specialized sigma24 family protein